MLGGRTMTEDVLLGARISAGLYFAFAVALMPALHGLGDAGFVDTMNRINVSIVNPIFLLILFAAPVLAVVAAVLVHSPLVYAAAALGVSTPLITLAANVLLNDRLTRNETQICATAPSPATDTQSRRPPSRRSRTLAPHSP